MKKGKLCPNLSLFQSFTSQKNLVFAFSFPCYFQKGYIIFKWPQCHNTTCFHHQRNGMKGVWMCGGIYFPLIVRYRVYPCQYHHRHHDPLMTLDCFFFMHKKSQQKKKTFSRFGNKRKIFSCVEEIVKLSQYTASFITLSKFFFGTEVR